MRVVTVGGSVAALAAALLLARRAHEVTVVERDGGDWPADREGAWAHWPRPGVPHLRQLHIFNARGRAVLAAQLPDVHEAWLAAGAFETDLGDGVVRVNSRRTTFEWVLRTAATRQPGITLRTGTAVTGLVRHPAVGHVAGVVTDEGEIAADLVVDASGRRAVAARWVGGVATQVGRCGTIAATRWYRMRDGLDVPPQQRADLGYAACVLVPADGGMFSVTFGYQRGDTGLKPLRAVPGFAAAAAAVEPIARWVDPTRAEPVSGVLNRGDAANRLRTTRDAPPGLVLLGDAAVCTNPGYGRGIGLALVHAAGLADLDDPVGEPEAFAAFTAAELAPWYRAAVASDRTRRSIAARAIAGEPRGEIGGDGDDPDIRFARRLPEACRRDPFVNRTFQRAWHLLAPPSTLWDDPAIRSVVDAVPPPPAAGPDHAELSRLLAK